MSGGNDVPESSHNIDDKDEFEILENFDVSSEDSSENEEINEIVSTQVNQIFETIIVKDNSWVDKSE